MFFFIFQSYFTVCSGVCERKCYCLLNIGTFTDGKLSVSVSSVGWEKWVDEIQLKMMNGAWCIDPSSSSFRSLCFSVLLISLPMLLLWKGFLSFSFPPLSVSWCPLLVCCGITATPQDHWCFHKRQIFISLRQKEGQPQLCVWFFFFPLYFGWWYWRRSCWILCLESGMNGCDN